jgi:hypothetical protein
VSAAAGSGSKADAVGSRLHALVRLGPNHRDSDAPAASPREALACCPLLATSLPGNASRARMAPVATGPWYPRARYLTGTARGWPFSVIKSAKILSGLVVLVFLAAWTYSAFSEDDRR